MGRRALNSPKRPFPARAGEPAPADRARVSELLAPAIRQTGLDNPPDNGVKAGIRAVNQIKGAGPVRRASSSSADGAKKRGPSDPAGGAKKRGPAWTTSLDNPARPSRRAEEGGGAPLSAAAWAAAFPMAAAVAAEGPVETVVGRSGRARKRVSYADDDRAFGPGPPGAVKRP